MQIKVISSGSHGNAITVSDGFSTLLLDCGLPYSKLARQVKCSEIAGVLVSHEHLDHARAVPEMIRRGVEVYMSRGTALKVDLRLGIPVTYRMLNSLVELQIGTWKVLPFNVIHDAAEPMGFFFESIKTGKRGVYIVDSAYVDFDFPKVTHWLIEANYQEELLESGPYEEYLKDRVRQNHFSLENLKVFLRTSDLSQTEEIWLLHLSDSNSDEAVFVEEIQSLTGVPTYAA